MLWIGLGITAVGVASCAAISMKTKPVSEAPTPVGWPEPTAVGKIEVKRYPSVRLAVVRSAQSGSSNGMFGELFNHIKSNDIPMTAPVEMTYAVKPGATGKIDMSQESMAFYYQDQSVGTLGKQENVEVLDAEATTVVSVGLKGGYSDGNYRKAYAQLLGWLDENADKYSSAGPARVLAYNSPFVPWFMKYSEVQITIRETPTYDRGAPR